MQERMELLRSMLSLEPDQLELVITLFETERTQQAHAGASPQHQTET